MLTASSRAGDSVVGSTLIQRAQTSGPGAARAKAELLQRHRHLIDSYVRSMAEMQEYEDARQEAKLAYLEALDHFRPDRGATLTTFAHRYLRGALRRSWEQRAGKDYPISVTDAYTEAEALDLTGATALDLPDEVDVAAEAIHAAELPDLQQQVLAFVATLDTIDQTIIGRIFWDGLSKAEVARELGISRAAVGQRVEKIFRRGRGVLARFNPDA